jgi:regulatory protein YycI of two-component signal transduction system YycFG
MKRFAKRTESTAYAKRKQQKIYAKIQEPINYSKKKNLQLMHQFMSREMTKLSH